MTVAHVATTAGIGVAMAPVDPGASAAVGVLLNVVVTAAIALGLFLVVRARS